MKAKREEETKIVRAVFTLSTGTEITMTPEYTVWTPKFGLPIILSPRQAVQLFSEVMVDKTHEPEYQI